MTNKQKRLEIVKDVLDHLNITNIKTGNYLVDIDQCFLDENINLQSQLDKLRKNCRMCAKGALFVGHIAKYNKVSLDLLGYDNGYIGVEPETIKETLDYFDPDQLNLIETAFECGVVCPTEYNLDYRAIKFGRRYDDPKLRLRAILRNIIENDGEFVP